MTIQKITIGLIAVALFVGSMTAHAADFGAGVKAYNRGDYATALRIFRQFSDQGDAEAQFNLGFMYDEGATKDYKEAVKWYRKAANQGEALTQGKLGLMYKKGWGVTQDYVQAYMWYNLAAAQGQKDAGKSRDHLANTLMTPAQIAEAQKLAREWKPKGK